MLRQLDQRTTGGLTVTLLWDSEADIVLLWYDCEGSSAGSFRCVVEPGEAWTAFLDPLALQRARTRLSGATPPATRLAPPRMRRAAEPYGEPVVEPFGAYEAGEFAAEIPLGDNYGFTVFLCTFWLLCVVLVISMAILG